MMTLPRARRPVTRRALPHPLHALLASLPLLLPAGCAPLSAAEQAPFYVGRLHDTRLPALVTVETGGARLDLVFDSGANLLLFDTAAPRLTPGQKTTRQGLINAHGTTTAVTVGRVEKLALGSREFTSLRASSGDVSLFRDFVGLPCAGVIPAELAGACSFDFDLGELRLFADAFENAAAPAHSAEHPLKMVNHLPTVTLDAGPVRMRLLIDTGSNECLALSRATVALLLKHGMVEMDTARGKAIGLGELREDVSRGWFTQGSLMGRDLRGTAFSITGGEELLGMGWLMAFNFVIDFKKHRLLVQKRASPAPPIPIELMAGAVFRYTPQGLIVERLKPGGGPAEAAGLRPGDRLTTLAGTALPGIDGYALTALMRQHAGTAVPFTVYKHQAEAAAANANANASNANASTTNSATPARRPENAATAAAPTQGTLHLGPIISEWDFAGRPASGK